MLPNTQWSIERVDKLISLKNRRNLPQHENSNTVIHSLSWDFRKRTIFLQTLMWDKRAKKGLEWSFLAHCGDVCPLCGYDDQICETIWEENITYFFLFRNSII